MTLAATSNCNGRTAPAQWADVALSTVADVVMGQSPRSASYNNRGVGSPLINGPTEFTERYPVTIQWTSEPTRLCRTGDLLICVRGSSTGRTNRADDTYAIGRGVAAIRGRNDNDTEFVSFQVMAGVSRVLAATTGSTFPSIDGRSLRKLPICVPTDPGEQRAIAAALSDVDGLIASLDRLIAKKRAIKQAAMQQLLTGKTRLPGFKGKWPTITLGRLGHFLKGRGVTKDEAASGDIACVRYGELYTHHNDIIRSFNSRISPAVARTAVRLQLGDVLFAGSGETKEDIGRCAALVSGEEAYAGGDIVILRPDEGKSDAGFLGYFLNTSAINRQKASRGQGDAVVHISSVALAAILCRMPEPNEQAAIANVLCEMDAALAALIRRRDKAKAIKQGMMQALLTGRVRLPVKAAAGGTA